jgi:hypothetical protein
MTDDLLRSLTKIIADAPEGVLPAGSQGITVSDYDHGVYLVEFQAPWHVIHLS